MLHNIAYYAIFQMTMHQNPFGSRPLSEHTNISANFTPMLTILKTMNNRMAKRMRPRQTAAADIFNENDASLHSCILSDSSYTAVLPGAIRI